MCIVVVVVACTLLLLFVVVVVVVGGVHGVQWSGTPLLQESGTLLHLTVVGVVGVVAVDDYLLLLCSCCW